MLVLVGPPLDEQGEQKEQKDTDTETDKEGRLSDEYESQQLAAAAADAFRFVALFFRSFFVFGFAFLFAARCIVAGF